MWMPLLQWWFNSTAIGVVAYISNWISLFYIDMITYPCPNPDADLADHCLWKRSQEINAGCRCYLAIRGFDNKTHIGIPLTFRYNWIDVVLLFKLYNRIKWKVESHLFYHVSLRWPYLNTCSNLLNMGPSDNIDLMYYYQNGNGYNVFTRMGEGSYMHIYIYRINKTLLER